MCVCVCTYIYIYIYIYITKQTGRGHVGRGAGGAEEGVPGEAGPTLSLLVIRYNFNNSYLLDSYLVYYIYYLIYLFYLLYVLFLILIYHY